ncbi:putative zinc-binding protein [Clostridium sp.]|uniref:putative zinc-binding protein n=1 Tax=Clostridium sp. TaxID=1506 RepID=UPI001A60B136|nr:putative zinc-binding protein [Clostridium sp.]MBK5241082.1 hypothetical protein [Clostridium sp.]
MSKVKVIACSGMGKVFGLMSREVALHITTDLKPSETDTVCLAHIVTGDADAKEKIEGCSCITIDGCPALCAAKNVEVAGGIVKAKYKTVDQMKKHRGVNAGTATVLTEDGWKVVDELSAEICIKVDEILKEEK